MWQCLSNQAADSYEDGIQKLVVPYSMGLIFDGNSKVDYSVSSTIKDFKKYTLWVFNFKSALSYKTYFLFKQILKNKTF